MVSLRSALAALTGDIQMESTLMTADGGFARKMINKSGAPSVKGTIVHSNPSISNSFTLIPVNDLDPIGIVYEAGVADASECWVVFTGKAYVLLTNALGATGEGYVRVGITADTGEEAGKGVWEALPSSPFATDKHFQEVGHNLEITAAPGLCLCAIHFN